MDPLPTVDGPGIHFDPATGIKTFIPLENNPTVLTPLAHTLGLHPRLAFHDILSLSPPDTAHIPRPIHALILICPAAVYHSARDAEYAAQQPYTGPMEGEGEREEVLWIRQTIGHSCGLMALLHAALNLHPWNNPDGQGAEDAVLRPGSILARFRDAIVPLDPEARARYLYDDREIEAAHMRAARGGDSVVPEAREGNWNHFICFVEVPDDDKKGNGKGRLWELNGGMKGPVDRGVLGEGEDVLSERGVEMGVGGFMRLAGEGDVGFSVVALAPAVEEDGGVGY